MQMHYLSPSHLCILIGSVKFDAYKFNYIHSESNPHNAEHELTILLYWLSSVRSTCGKVLVPYINQVKYNKTCLKQLLKNRQNKSLKDKWYLGAFCNTFDPH